MGTNSCSTVCLTKSTRDVQNNLCKYYNICVSMRLMTAVVYAYIIISA